mmetsp:Transcript_26082/g.66352  ORF Transcript_26082/g.66352 Transcript_26082/m.66352 type:complete len:255 (-) Transcript_26082:2833-3597(-)
MALQARNVSRCLVNVGDGAAPARCGSGQHALQLGLSGRLVSGAVSCRCVLTSGQRAGRCCDILCSNRWLPVALELHLQGDHGLLHAGQLLLPDSALGAVGEQVDLRLQLRNLGVHVVNGGRHARRGDACTRQGVLHRLQLLLHLHGRLLAQVARAKHVLQLAERGLHVFARSKDGAQLLVVDVVALHSHLEVLEAHSHILLACLQLLHHLSQALDLQLGGQVAQARLHLGGGAVHGIQVHDQLGHGLLQLVAAG